PRREALAGGPRAVIGGREGTTGFFSVHRRVPALCRHAGTVRGCARGGPRPPPVARSRESAPRSAAPGDPRRGFVQRPEPLGVPVRPRRRDVSLPRIRPARRDRTDVAATL